MVVEISENTKKAEFKRVLKPLIDHFKKEYSLSNHDIISIISGKEEPLIPLSVFSSELAPLQCIIKYLKESLELKNNEIANLIKRDSRVVWKTYKEASKKHPSKFRIKKEKYYLPVSSLNSSLSILENISYYLKEELNLSIKKITKLLNKKQSTIYTVYNRAKSKIETK